MNELVAAGISEPRLRASYKECKRLNASHGKTYYLATLLLPPAKRPHVHALYGFARYADEIVDDLASTLTQQQKTQELDRWSDQVISDIESGQSSDLIAAALVDTINRFDIPISYFQAFLNSMKMDLTITEYQTYNELSEYIYGSAAVIGLQMVAVLGTDKTSDLVQANISAQKLGIAFQLANFIRDVGEDLDRGRVYLPLQELQSHGVTKQMLQKRVVTPQIRNALKEQIQRVRQLQSESKDGINLLSVGSRACIFAASELYCGIVDEVEKIDYQIFSKRAKTSSWRRIKVALPAYLNARKSR